MIKATVKEVDRTGRKELRVLSRKGKPIQAFPINRGMRNDVIAFFKDNDLKPTNNSPEWLKKGVLR